MRTRSSVVAGVAAVALALTGCGAAAGVSGAAHGGHAGSVAAGHAQAGMGVADLTDLAQVKRDAMRHAVDRVRFPARQPQTDPAGLADLRGLAKLKRDSVRKVAGHAWGR